MNRSLRQVILLLTALLLHAGCSGEARRGAEEPTPTPIPTPIVPEKPTYVVQRGGVERKLEFTARVAPVKEEELFFRSSGRVRAVFVETGDSVRKGELLAELEIAELQRQLAKAKLDVETAQKQLSTAEQTQADALACAQLNLRTAQAQLQEARTLRAHNLALAQLDLEVKQLQVQEARHRDLTPRRTLAEIPLQRAEQALAQAQAAYDEIAWRGDAGASPQAQALQQATLDYQEAQAAYDLIIEDLDQQSLELAILEKQVAVAILTVQRLEEQNDDPQLTAAVALAELDVQRLQRGVDPQLEQALSTALLAVDNLEARMAEGRLIAPFDGEISSFSAYAGRTVEAFKPVCLIADPGALEASAGLASGRLRELVEGQEVTAIPSSYPGSALSGTIRKLPYPYGSGGGTQTLEEVDKSTRIALEADAIVEVGLQAGDLLKVMAVLERKEDVLWLPPQSVRLFEGRRFVVVQEGDLQRRVDVTVGIRGEDCWEIEAGLVEGQIVVSP